MTSSSGIAEIAKRYALALYGLAEQGRLLDAIAADLKDIKAMVAGSPELQRLVRSPVMSRDAQVKAVGALAAAAGMQPMTAKFLGVIATNRRLFVLPQIADAFMHELATRRGEQVAHVTAAVPLSADQMRQLEDAVRAAAGGKAALDLTVDPAILGGLIVRIGSRMIDTSLRSKLQRLQLAMKGVA